MNGWRLSHEGPVFLQRYDLIAPWDEFPSSKLFFYVIRDEQSPPIPRHLRHAGLPYQLHPTIRREARNAGEALALMGDVLDYPKEWSGDLCFPTPLYREAPPETLRDFERFAYAHDDAKDDWISESLCYRTPKHIKKRMERYGPVF